MRHIIKKFFVDFEKEENFLNEMSENGLALTGYSWGKYTFEDAPKGEYIYRLELLERPINHSESQGYIQFMEEAGAELAASYHRWAYFRKKATDGEFTIYSDNESKIKHYSRIMLLFLIITGFNLYIGVFNLYIGNMSSSHGHPPISSYVSILSFSVVALILFFLVIPLRRKINALEKEKKIRE